MPQWLEGRRGAGEADGEIGRTMKKQQTYQLQIKHRQSLPSNCDRHNNTSQAQGEHRRGTSKQGQGRNSCNSRAQQVTVGGTKGQTCQRVRRSATGEVDKMRRNRIGRRGPCKCSRLLLGCLLVRPSSVQGARQGSGAGRIVTRQSLFHAIAAR